MCSIALGLLEEHSLPLQLHICLEHVADEVVKRDIYLALLSEYIYLSTSEHNSDSKIHPD